MSEHMEEDDAGTKALPEWVKLEYVKSPASIAVC